MGGKCRYEVRIIHYIVILPTAIIPAHVFVCVCGGGGGGGAKLCLTIAQT